VDEVYLVGIDAQYSVYSTAKGALNRGYKVNLITDATPMANKEMG
jgi:nicotinamidase-related amidase